MSRNQSRPAKEAYGAHQPHHTPNSSRIHPLCFRCLRCRPLGTDATLMSPPHLSRNVLRGLFLNLHPPLLRTTVFDSQFVWVDDDQHHSTLCVALWCRSRRSDAAQESHIRPHLRSFSPSVQCRQTARRSPPATSACSKLLWICCSRVDAHWHLAVAQGHDRS
jgi:hypothetical protein